MNKTIYKKDTKGKIRVLTIFTDGDKVVQDSGILDGALTRNVSHCIGKNIGKANETTPNAQAILEATAKLKKKLEKEYFETIEQAQAQGGSAVMLPMLAHDYNKHKAKVIFPCNAQPKLDGMRCLGTTNSLTSRGGKNIGTMQHILDAIHELHPSITLDGELYAHGYSFQQNMERIKKYRPGLSEEVCYHVYDLVTDERFTTRHDRLEEIVEQFPALKLVETVTVYSEEELMAYHRQNIAAGYEGTMVRYGKDSYAINARSYSLLKLKDFIDFDYTIVDVIPNESVPTQGTVVCTIDPLQTMTFKCGMKMSHSEREELLVNKASYIGRKANVRFFEYTDSGIPRFPVCVGIHLDR